MEAFETIENNEVTNEVTVEPQETESGKGAAIAVGAGLVVLGVILHKYVITPVTAKIKGIIRKKRTGDIDGGYAREIKDNDGEESSDAE